MISFPYFVLGLMIGMVVMTFIVIPLLNKIFRL
jgi:hypothetical protein